MDRRWLFSGNFPNSTAAVSDPDPSGDRAPSVCRRPEVASGGGRSRGAEEFVFAANRRRWKYLRPVAVAAAASAGLWVVALGWVLLRSPALPGLRRRARITETKNETGVDATVRM
jgi:hypothetical protein